MVTRRRIVLGLAGALPKKMVSHVRGGISAGWRRGVTHDMALKRVEEACVYDEFVRRCTNSFRDGRLPAGGRSMRLLVIAIVSVILFILCASC